MSQNHYWYIEPGGNILTNERLSELLQGEGACEDIMCADGNRRNMWRCEHKHVREMMYWNVGFPQINFKIFVQEGQNGKIRLWPFDRKRRKVVVRNSSRSDRHKVLPHLATTDHA